MVLSTHGKWRAQVILPEAAATTRAQIEECRRLRGLTGELVEVRRGLVPCAAVGGSRSGPGGQKGGVAARLGAKAEQVIGVGAVGDIEAVKALYGLAIDLVAPWGTARAAMNSIAMGSILGCGGACPVEARGLSRSGVDAGGAGREGIAGEMGMEGPRLHSYPFVSALLPPGGAVRRCCPGRAAGHVGAASHRSGRRCGDRPSRRATAAPLPYAPRRRRPG